MFRFVVIAIGVLLTAFQSPPRQLPQLSPPLLAVVENVEAARAFDYMGLKAEGADLQTLSNAVYVRARAHDGQNRRCLSDAEAEVQSSLSAALAAENTQNFADDRVAAEQAIVKWRAFSKRLAEGEIATEPPFSWVSERYAAAAREPDPRVRELLKRTAGDQLIRRAFEGGDQIWGSLSSGARGRVDTFLSKTMCETDGENTAWLKADIAGNGWYLISKNGEAASQAAWLMTQHADRDPEFQRHVLTLLEPLVAQKETSAANYAYLYDRIAVGSNRPQRYGTQGRCVAKDIWAPNDIEDPERVEALRADADIGTLPEYTALMHRYCADFTG